MTKTAEKVASQSFSFTKENLKTIEKHMGKYPKGREQSALLPMLDIAQRQNGGWLSYACLEAVAKLLNLSPLKVHEVASFYSMFHLDPVGKYHVQVCGTTPCMLRGAEALCERAKKHLGIELKEVTSDGLFSIEEVECLGGCVNAPIVQINDDYFEDLTEDALVDILDKCRGGKMPKPFSAAGRMGSAPFEGMPEESVSKKKRSTKETVTEKTEVIMQVQNAQS